MVNYLTSLCLGPLLVKLGNNICVTESSFAVGARMILLNIMPLPCSKLPEDLPTLKAEPKSLMMAHKTQHNMVPPLLSKLIHSDPPIFSLCMHLIALLAFPQTSQASVPTSGPLHLLFLLAGWNIFPPEIYSLVFYLL